VKGRTEPVQQRRLVILRYDPAQHRRYRQAYVVAVEDGWSVLDCLNRIRWEQDSSLVFRRSCGSGVCGSCAMSVNGRNVLACTTRVADLRAGSIVVGPLRKFRIIRDLVVDMDPFLERLRSVDPVLRPATPPPPDREYRQTPEQRGRLDGLYECNLCGACTSACLSSSSDPRYLGPAALLQAGRFHADSRDGRGLDRLSAVDHPSGIWGCRDTHDCVTACPRGLRPAEVIARLRRALLRAKLRLR
jgi:succinate dehydrogenase / fumarate reductase iron-sulfur subunit